MRLSFTSLDDLTEPVPGNLTPTSTFTEGYTIVTQNDVDSFTVTDVDNLFALADDGTGIVDVSITTFSVVKEVNGAILESDDLPQNHRLRQPRYANSIAALEILGVLATDGRQAVVAWQEGDAFHFTIYSSKTALGILDALPTQTTPKPNAGRASRAFKKVRGLGLLTIGIGVLEVVDAAQEYQQNPNAIAKRRLSERVWSISVDTGISFIPWVGVTAEVTWAVAGFVDSLFGDPDRVSRTQRLAPTVGSALVLFGQYFFTNKIPSAISEEALADAVDSAIGEVEYKLSIGVPAVFIEPE